MSEANASRKTEPDQRTSDREQTEAPAESLTDLIDVLQRQSFTRRFEVQTNGPVASRESSPACTAPPGRERSGSAE